MMELQLQFRIFLLICKLLCPRRVRILHCFGCTLSNMFARRLVVMCILGTKIDSLVLSVMEEHGSIVQSRPSSNLLRITIWITSGFLAVFRISLIFLQQVSPSLIIGLDFCNRRLNKNFLFRRIFCNTSPWSFLTFGQFFDQVCYCSVKTELIDRNDHLVVSTESVRAAARSPTSAGICVFYR